MNRINHDVDQNTPEWFKLRLGVPTASNFAKIMANYPKQFGNPAKEYAMRLALESVTGEEVKDDFKSKWMEHGQEIESTARSRYQGDNCIKVKNGSFHTCELSGLKIGASPDGLIDDDGCIEIKCVKWNTHFNQIIEGGYDRAYNWQIHGQLFVTGRKWCDWISYCEDFPTDKQIYTFRVEQSTEEAMKLTDRLSQFKLLIDNYKEILMK